MNNSLRIHATIVVKCAVVTVGQLNGNVTGTRLVTSATSLAALTPLVPRANLAVDRAWTVVAVDDSFRDTARLATVSRLDKGTSLGVSARTARKVA